MNRDFICYNIVNGKGFTTSVIQADNSGFGFVFVVGRNRYQIVGIADVQKVRFHKALLRTFGLGFVEVPVFVLFVVELKPDLETI